MLIPLHNTSPTVHSPCSLPRHEHLLRLIAYVSPPSSYFSPLPESRLHRARPSKTLNGFKKKKKMTALKTQDSEINQFNAMSD